MSDKYLVYNKKADIDKIVDDIWKAYKLDMQEKGFTIINDEIVPKNAVTGINDLTAQRTIAWITPSETVDNKFAIPEPSINLKDAITIQPVQELTGYIPVKDVGVKPEVVTIEIIK